MSALNNPFMSKIFVGNPTSVGKSRDKYENVLMDNETVDMEFKGIRDGMLFTSHRMIVLNYQGITGKKVEVSSFPWKSISAYSVENSGAIDLDAELKICGSGWGVCEVSMTKGTNVREICQYINSKIFS